ncbi:MAG TPA: DoxX family protein [Candidatus Didemnitutus sp.]|nr:DoxX family protein [Candidatus Didemnitutus sp.]
MSPTPPPAPVSKAALWTGYILSALPSLMMLFSAWMKFAKPPAAIEGFNHMGIPITMADGLGVLEIVCVLVYLFPRTAVLGAILMTGYLGGATMSGLRVGDPWFATPVLGVLCWGGLYLRDPRVRALIPLRS